MNTEYKATAQAIMQSAVIFLLPVVIIALS